MFRHAMCHISDAEIKTRRADYVAKMGDFLLPINYGGHEHTWTYITTGVQFCSLCGAEHVCFRVHLLFFCCLSWSELIW